MAKTKISIKKRSKTSKKKRHGFGGDEEQLSIVGFSWTMMEKRMDSRSMLKLLIITIPL